MTTKERILAACSGRGVDYVPLTTWCFGFAAPQRVTWSREGRPVRFWYSLRMEHIHSLPQPWTLEDDFERFRAWRSLGVDDVLDISVPWSMHPEVVWTDSVVQPAGGEPGGGHAVMRRTYTTPEGTLRHAVRRTGEYLGDGWVVQPDHVPLFEDFNIPRAVRHAVSGPEDVRLLRYFYAPPDAEASRGLVERAAAVGAFGAAESAPVQAWSAFGMDAAVWLAGTENAVLLAMDSPSAFGRLLDGIHETDLARTELAASQPAVDIVVERGWYSSTDFWSPALFDELLFPRIEELARAAHRHGKLFAYVMTTGVRTLGPRLADAGVDILYFVDPVQDRIALEEARDLLASRMTLVGGTSALSLAAPAAGTPGRHVRLEDEVKRALDVLGPTERFILHPVDAIFPDTPADAMDELIDLWKRYR